MDPDNSVVKLCVAGMCAEGKGRLAEVPGGWYGDVVRRGAEGCREFARQNTWERRGQPLATLLA
jgi:hypothetical protein